LRLDEYKKNSHSVIVASMKKAYLFFRQRPTFIVVAYPFMEIMMHNNFLSLKVFNFYY
jgi:hypothetical protein